MGDDIDMSTFGDGGDIGNDGDDDILDTNVDNIIDDGQIPGPSTSTDSKIKYDTRGARLRAEVLKNEVSALYSKLNELFPETTHYFLDTTKFRIGTEGAEKGRLYYIVDE